jgi:hypothetical protein
VLEAPLIMINNRYKNSIMSSYKISVALFIYAIIIGFIGVLNSEALMFSHVSIIALMPIAALNMSLYSIVRHYKSNPSSSILNALRCVYLYFWLVIPPFSILAVFSAIKHIS